MVERSHRQLKDALRSQLAGVSWFCHLPWVLLGICSTLQEDSAVSSAEMVYGSPLTLPGQFLEASDPFEESFIQDLRTKMKLWTPPQTHHHNKSNQTPFVPEALSTVILFLFLRMYMFLHSLHYMKVRSGWQASQKRVLNSTLVQL